MVTVSSGNIFVGDFVSFNVNGVAMIGSVKFFMKVCKYYFERYKVTLDLSVVM